MAGPVPRGPANQSLMPPQSPWVLTGIIFHSWGIYDRLTAFPFYAAEKRGPERWKDLPRVKVEWELGSGQPPDCRPVLCSLLRYGTISEYGTPGHGEGKTHRARISPIVSFFILPGIPDSASKRLEPQTAFQLSICRCEEPCLSPSKQEPLQIDRCLWWNMRVYTKSLPQFWCIIIT